MKYKCQYELGIYNITNTFKIPGPNSDSRKGSFSKCKKPFKNSTRVKRYKEKRKIIEISSVFPLLYVSLKLGLVNSVFFFVVSPYTSENENDSKRHRSHGTSRHDGSYSMPNYRSASGLSLRLLRLILSILSFLKVMKI